MALLKLVASHLDLETSLFCPVTVDWPMVRQLTLSTGDKCPGSLRDDARAALRMQTERAMQAAGLHYTDADIGEKIPWQEDGVPKAGPRKKNSLCRETICMCLDWHRRHQEAAAYVIPGETITRGLCLFFNRNPGLITNGVLRLILYFFNAVVAPKFNACFCGMLFAHEIHGNLCLQARVDWQHREIEDVHDAIRYGVAVAMCQRRSRGEIELLLHGQINVHPEEMYLILEHLKIHKNAVDTSVLRPALHKMSSTEYRNFLRATVFNAEGCRLGMPGALAALLDTQRFRRHFRRHNHLADHLEDDLDQSILPSQVGFDSDDYIRLRRLHI